MASNRRIVTVIIIIILTTFRVKATHVLGLLGIEGTHLDLVLQDGVWVTLKEHFIDCHVQAWDDLWSSGGGGSGDGTVRQEKKSYPNASGRVKMV